MLSPAERFYLQSHGVSAATIDAYNKSPSSHPEINKLLDTFHGSTPNQKILPTPIAKPNIWDDPNAAAGALLGSGALGDWNATPTGGASVPALPGSKVVPRYPAGQGGPRMPGGSGTFPAANTPIRPSNSPATAGTGNGLPGGITPFQYNAPTNPYGMPNMPSPYTFSIPSVEMHDYTDRAKQMAADAFAPYLAAFDIARTNAEKQGATSKEATAGLYANFQKDIQKAAAETAARYDSTKADQAARGTAQQADIAENQQSANANVGQQLGALGLQTSAPTVLQQGANNQAQAQDQAGAATESQQQFYDAEKLAQGNYDSGYGLLMQKAGIGAQQDLSSQLMNILANIDINKANASGQQTTTALDLAQKLSDRDLQAQQANAGYSLQGQGLQYQAGQDAFRNQLGLHNTFEGENQNNFANAEDVWYKQNSLINDALAKSGQATPFNMSDYPDKSRPYGVVMRDTGDPNLSNQAVNAIAQAYEQFRNQPNDPNSVATVQGKALTFANWIAQQAQIAQAAGIPEHTLREAAAEYVTTNEQ